MCLAINTSSGWKSALYSIFAKKRPVTISVYIIIEQKGLRNYAFDLNRSCVRIASSNIAFGNNKKEWVVDMINTVYAGRYFIERSWCF